MTERGAVQERINQLMIMEEDRILTGFHQEVQKARDKAWHDIHIKRKNFKEGDLVLVYDNKSLQHPRKLRMHWSRTIRNKDFHRRGSCRVEGFRRNKTQRDDQWESIEAV
jgi:hypothetical protein